MQRPIQLLLLLDPHWIIDGRLIGEFDGNNKTIYGLSIVVNNVGEAYGIFGTVEQYGLIKNVSLENISITCNTTGTGILATSVGAIVGRNQGGDLINCNVSSGYISVALYNAWVGGIAGLSSSGQMINCNNTGVTLYGHDWVGGIVGAGINARIENCVSYATVNYYYDTESGCAGGIVGKSTGTTIITGCINRGLIKYASQSSNSTNIKPCMAQIVGWLQSGTESNNSCLGSTNFDNLKWIYGQKQYCSNSVV